MTDISKNETDTVCPYCKQRVPLRRDGTRVTHYEPIKVAKGCSQRKCKGSQEESYDLFKVRRSDRF